MEKALNTVTYWIPPTPCNFFKLGLFLEIPYSALIMLDKREFNFFKKVYEMLLMGYIVNGDHFAPKLYKGMRYLGVVSYFHDQVKLNHWEDPFLLAQAINFVWPEDAQLDECHYINQLCMEVSTIIHYEPGIDVLAPLHFGLPPQQFVLESHLSLKVFDILKKAYSKMETTAFLRQLKKLLEEVKAHVYLREICSTHLFLPSQIKEWVL